MKRSTAFRLAWPLAAAALLASCSVVRTMESQDSTRQVLLNAYAGKPVTHITYLGVRPGLMAISADQILTWTDFTQAHAYLITVGKGCANLYTTGGEVTSTGNQVWARADHVLSDGACQIQTIQPVDWLRVQRELAQLDQPGQRAVPSAAAVQGG